MIARGGLMVIGALWALTGLVILAAPRAFYDAIPGLAAMGPFNMHFIMDVGLAFLASGSAAAWSAHRLLREAALVAVAWPTLHALFHLQVWGHRGFPVDAVFLFDAVALMAPAALAVTFALRLKRA